MGSIKEFQFYGCLGRHGSYSFYKSIKIDGRLLSLASFFPVRIYPDSAILSIAEVQLLWSDRTENFVGLRLYFLPENTPEGRKRHHGEDEVLALQDKVILRAGDLSSWLVDESDWDWGFVCPSTGIKGESGSEISSNSPTSQTKSCRSDKLTKSDKTRESPNELNTGSNRVVVLSYEKYVRVRTILKRLEGSKTDLSNWLSHPLVLALGGINISPSSRILFSKEVFDYPELEDHELLCNHLAPKLKGRPRKKRKRDRSLGSESNNSSSSTTSGGSEEKKSINGIGKSKGKPSNQDLDKESKFSPKSITPPVSHPSSPSAASSETGQEKDTSFGMISSNTGELQITKIEPGESKESIGKIPVKVDNFHPGKKRNLPKAGSNSSTPSPHSTSPLDPKIELESTTIRFASSPTTIITSQQSDTKNNGLLEQSIVELAQKLEKSNALQILPVRTSAISSQELNNGDSEFPRGTPPFKKRKTDEYKSTPSITISEKHVQISGIDKPTTKSNMHNLPRNINGKHKIVSNNHLTKTEFLQPQPAHIHNNSSQHLRPISKNDKVDGPKAFEVDTKRTITPPNWSSPCPYLPTTMIFGDPAISKHPKAEPQNMKSPISRLDKSSINGLRSGCSNGSNSQPPQDVLDFSMKRLIEPKSSHQALNVNVNVNVNLETECLDLSVRPQSHKSKHVFHSLSDIPPPNAMNQLGLRLTSEVTLFPSMQHEAHRGRSSSTGGKPSTRVRDRDSQSHSNSQALKSSSNQSMSSTSINRSHQVPSRSPMNDSVPKNLSSYAQNSNPHVWRPGSSAAPSSSTPPVPQHRGTKEVVHQSSNSSVHRTSKSKSPVQHTVNNIDRSQAGSRGPSAKPSPTLNLNHPQPELDPRINLQQLAQCYGPFMFPPPFGFPGQDPRQQIDPAYLQMLSMQFPPMMGMPPGNMDTLHHYIQQGMIQPPNWAPFSLQPPTSSKSPRGGPK